jgi:hypothetical protein
MRRALLVVPAFILSAAGCGGQSSSSFKVMVTVSEGDTKVDVVDSAAPEVVITPPPMARCCVMPAPAAHDGGDAATSNDTCSILARNGFGVSEPCVTGNEAGLYGVWTCGADASVTACGDRGLACSVGDPCTLLDVGCPGVVQVCATPPPPG